MTRTFFLRCWPAVAAVTLMVGGRLPGEVPTAGLSLWLRADQHAERAKSAAVETWENGAPAAAGDALQGDPVRRPRWIRSVDSLGGKPAVEFDGEDDYLHVPWLRVGPRATVYVVAENAEQTAGGTHWRTLLGGDDDPFRDGATKYAFGFRRADYEPAFVANLYYAPEKAWRLMEATSPPPAIGFHIYGFLRDGAAPNGMVLRADGAPVAALTAEKDPPGFPGTGYTIGQGGDVTHGKASRFYRGRVAEILCYDRPLDAIEVLRVEEYLAGKYGLSRTPAPPTRGLSLWLNVDSLRERKVGDGIERWADASGSGHDAHGGEPGQRPAYLSREINGRPAVGFAGGSAGLDFGGWRPPPGGAVYAAVRERAGERSHIARELPAIDPAWADGKARFSGALSELLVYDRTLSKQEGDELGRYLDF